MRNVLFRCVALMLVVLPLARAVPASAMTADQATSDVSAFYEWALGFKLDPALVQSINQGIASDMSSNPAATQATVNDMNNTIAWVKSHSHHEGALMRSLVEPQLIVSWQNDTVNTNGTSSALVAAWQKHNHIIANGKPPLRELVVNCYISLFDFLAKETGKSVPAAVANHAKFRQQVAAAYASASSAQQLQFNEYQTLWYQVQYMWKHATPAQQAAMRQQWRSGTSQAVAARPASVRPSSGYSGNTYNVQRWQEDNFVNNWQQSIISDWSAPSVIH